MNRLDADIIATKNMILDRRLGYELPLSYYKKQSDELCNKTDEKKSKSCAK